MPVGKWNGAAIGEWITSTRRFEEAGEGVNQWRKGIASWKVGSVLYLSIPFTWLLPRAEEIAIAHNGKVIAGGPAVKIMGAPWAETPDYRVDDQGDLQFEAQASGTI